MLVIQKQILDHVEHQCLDTFSIPKLENANCLLMVAVQEIETILNRLPNVRKSVSQAPNNIKKMEKIKVFCIAWEKIYDIPSSSLCIFDCIFPAKKRLFAWDLRVDIKKI